MSLSQTLDKMPEHRARTHTRQSSISSEASGASATSAQQADQSSAFTKQSPTPAYTAAFQAEPLPACQMDPLAREYPMPAQEIDVREALARKPMKWTLGHYIKDTPTREPHRQVEDKEKIARDLEAKKRELLQAKEELRKLSFPK